MQLPWIRFRSTTAKKHGDVLNLGLWESRPQQTTFSLPENLILQVDPGYSSNSSNFSCRFCQPIWDVSFRPPGKKQKILWDAILRYFEAMFGNWYGCFWVLFGSQCQKLQQNVKGKKKQHPKWMHDFAQQDSKNPYTFHVVFQMQSTLDIHGCYFLPLQFCWKKSCRARRSANPKLGPCRPMERPALDF